MVALPSGTSVVEHALAALAAAGEDDQRQVRPRGLLGQHLPAGARGLRVERLVGEDDGAGSGLDLAEQLGGARRRRSPARPSRRGAGRRARRRGRSARAPARAARGRSGSGDLGSPPFGEVSPLRISGSAPPRYSRRPVSTPWNSRSSRPTRSPSAPMRQLADAVLVGARAPLDQRDRLAHLAERLEVAQQDHRVGQVGDVDRRLHVSPTRPAWAIIRMVNTPCWPR